MQLPSWHRSIVIVALALSLVAPGRAESGPASAGRGTISHWVVHFDEEMPDAALATHVALLGAVDTDATVIVAVSSATGEMRARAMLGEAGARLDHAQFHRIGAPLSPWARDRCVIVDHAPGRQHVLVAPSSQIGASRKGDALVGDLLHRLTPSSTRELMRPYVEGGDLLVGDALALVGQGSVDRERRRLAVSQSELEDSLAHSLQRRLFVVGASGGGTPHEHLDMFLSLVDDRTVVLGDPMLARSLFDAAADIGVEDVRIGDFGSVSWRDQAIVSPQYASVAAELRAAGFKVHRVPALHAADATLLTWTNVVMDQRDGRQIVYLPVYGIPHLDRRARSVWARLGFEVRLIPSQELILHGGAVRCATNVIRDGPAGTRSVR